MPAQRRRSTATKRATPDRARKPAKQGARGKAPARRGAADNGLGLGGNAWSRSYAQGLRSVLDPETGLGTDMRFTRFVQSRILDEYEQSALFGDAIMQRVITYPVLRALACGYEIELDKDVPAELREALLRLTSDDAQRLGVDAQAALMGMRARGFGDAVGVVSFASDKTPRDLAQPPAWGQPVRWFQVWDVRDWHPVNYERFDNEGFRTQPGWLSLQLGRPILEAERWRGWTTGNYSSVSVHPRRYVRLHTRDGFPISQGVAPYYVMLLQASQGAAGAIARSSIAHWRIDGWSDMVRSRGAEAQAQMQAMFAGLTGANVAVTDGIGDKALEDFELHTNSLAGVSEGIYAGFFLFCAACGIPVSRVAGTSPGAFQSGETQDNMWYELLQELQIWLEPVLRWFWDAIFAAVLGNARTPVYVVRWKSPRVQKDSDILDARTKALKMAVDAITAKLLTPDAAIAGLNSDNPGGFQYEIPLAAPLAAVPGVTLAPTATAAPASPEPAAEPLSNAALNGAQVASLVSVATDPALTAEAKEAIIGASFPSIPKPLVSIIARGGMIAGLAGPAGLAAPLAPGGVAPLAPGATLATPTAGPVPVEGAEDGPDPPEAAAEPDLWRTAEQIAARFGAVTKGQLTRLSAPVSANPRYSQTVEGKLTWIKAGRERLWKLSDVEQFFALGGPDLEAGTADDPSEDEDDPA